MSTAVVVGTTTLTTRLFASGASTLRRAGASSWAYALFAQPTSVGWLCKEIIKIFRLQKKREKKTVLQKFWDKSGRRRMSLLRQAMILRQRQVQKQKAHRR